MGIKILILLNLLCYSIIVSQSFSYIIALRKVYLAMNAPSYIELRQLTDVQFMARFRWVMYAGLIAGLVLVLATLTEPGSILFLTSAYAFIALVTDAFISIKGNVPVNTVINSWTKENYPEDWALYRTLWFRFFQWRQIANISGFVSLLIGALFG